MKIVLISYEMTFGWRLRQSLTNSIILRPNSMIWCPQVEIPFGWRLMVFQPSGTRSWNLAAIWWNLNDIHTIFIPRWGLSHKNFRLSKVARAEIQAFQILSSRNFNFFVVQSVFRLWMVLHFLFSTVSFPVILLFWALSLSPVWLNIEGRQDFSYKTQILFFYSENN